MNEDICPICAISTEYLPTPFCTAHAQGWAYSGERREVDFTDDESYKKQVTAYAERAKNGQEEDSDER